MTIELNPERPVSLSPRLREYLNSGTKNLTNVPKKVLNRIWNSQQLSAQDGAQQHCTINEGPPPTQWAQGEGISVL